MKPEPLKDKKVSLGLYLDSVVNPLKQNVYIEKDLKSAVEWLKEEVNNQKWEDTKAMAHVPNETTNIRVDVLISILDKAFEDVTNK